MITLNVVRDNIIASVNGKNLSVRFSKELYDEAVTLYDASQDATTLDEFAEIANKFEALFKVDLEAAKAINENLIYDPNTRTYHLAINKVKHPVPMPQKLADDLAEAHDKGLPTDPIVKFWMRLLRNPKIHKNDPSNVAQWINSVVEYVTRTFTSPALYEQFKEQGFSHEVATEMATVRQTPFTMEGLICAKKVVTPLYDRTMYKFIKDENGEAKRVLRDTVEVTVDENTGNVERKVTYNEDWVFQPYVMGTHGDAFHCGPESKPDHIIRVGFEMFLDSWDKVNCDFNSVAVPGIHTGNQDYINGYERKDNVTLNCFVDPAEIGAVAAGDDVFRVRALFPYSIKDRETDNRNLYHSSTYAAQKDEEWAKIRAELQADYQKKQEEYIKALEAKNNLTAGL